MRHAVSGHAHCHHGDLGSDEYACVLSNLRWWAGLKLATADRRAVAATAPCDSKCVALQPSYTRRLWRGCRVPGGDRRSRPRRHPPPPLSAQHPPRVISHTCRPKADAAHTVAGACHGDARALNRAQPPIDRWVWRPPCQQPRRPTPASTHKRRRGAARANLRAAEWPFPAMRGTVLEAAGKPSAGRKQAASSPSLRYPGPVCTSSTPPSTTG